MSNRFTNWLFSWFRDKEEVTNPTKRQRRAPVSVDATDSMQCNAELTKGLYHNSYPGMKLSGAMAYTPIATPVWFMGVPTAIVDDNDNINEILKSITEDKKEQFSEIHTQCHRDGTIWIYPFYSAEDSKVIWEFIQDETVTDIIRDINTGKIIELITDEEILVSTGYNKTVYVRLQRIFTKFKVETKWLKKAGNLPTELKDRVQKNVSGTIPIAFSNNKDGNEVRGHSDYERILSDLKNYHDIDLQESTILAKYGPKLNIEVDNVKDWLSNNGYAADGHDINVARDDIFFNMYDRERVSYLLPLGIAEAYSNKLKNIFKKLVEGSGIPEILWGTKVSGNLGSYEDQMDQVVKLVQDKQKQKTKSYKKLFSITLQLEMSATIQNFEDIDIRIEWDYLDAISEETKSTIFKNFAEGMSTLINAAAITKEQAFKLLEKIYPDSTEDKLEDYKKGIAEMAAHVQYTKMPYELAADFRGETNEGIEINKEDTIKEAIENIQKYLKNLVNKK